jgi:hypothetical protein
MNQPMNIPKHVIDKKILWARCYLGLFSSMIMNNLICPINQIITKLIAPLEIYYGAI